jgi:alanine racemase
VGPREGRPTWAEVDLGAIAANYRALASLLEPGARLIPVVKADAYGHGGVAVTRTLAARGATLVAVAIAEEGIALRAAGLDCDILVLEGAWPGQEAAVIRHRLTPALPSLDGVERLDRAAADAGVELPVHVKLDTGMTRLGIPWDGACTLSRALARAPRLHLAGCFTHLACAEEEDRAFTLEQLRRFETAVATLRGQGTGPGELHVGNSAGLLHHPELRRFGARPGIALYGCPPARDRAPVPLRSALSLHSRIGRIAEVAPGASVGYNRRFVATRPTRTATVPIGYADGYRRALTGAGRAIVRGRWAPLAGAVSMDLVVLDVTEIPGVSEGDEVLLLGRSGACAIDADELAALAGTISYEILCGISPRVPRVHRS